jgi:hypothetical protein
VQKEIAPYRGVRSVDRGRFKSTMRRTTTALARLTPLFFLLTNACGAAALEAPARPSMPLSSVRAGAMSEAAPMTAPPSAAMTGAPSPTASPAPPPPAPAMPTSPGRPTSARNAKTVDPSLDTARAPILIYAGELVVMVDEARFAPTIDKAIDVAEATGGYLAGRKDASVQLRVPSAHFRDAMTRLESLGVVMHRSVSANDVSEEYHDAEVRLTNLRATRTRLQELLSKAPNVNDTLTVERELERVAMEIDQLEGRLQFLKAHAAYSQIDVALTPKPKDAPVVIDTHPSPRRYVELPVEWLGKIGIDRLTSFR